MKKTKCKNCSIRKVGEKRREKERQGGEQTEKEKGRATNGSKKLLKR